mmetsp:Transcript_124148/g.247352  ORF Transcript_124148/g.247352 Transcript_124148/m.247352 type:complete len:232 (-) Transcript_124148:82-777(-)
MASASCFPTFAGDGAKIARVGHPAKSKEVPCNNNPSPESPWAWREVSCLPDLYRCITASALSDFGISHLAGVVVLLLEDSQLPVLSSSSESELEEAPMAQLEDAHCAANSSDSRIGANNGAALRGRAGTGGASAKADSVPGQEPRTSALRRCPRSLCFPHAMLLPCCWTLALGTTLAVRPQAAPAGSAAATAARTRRCASVVGAFFFFGATRLAATMRPAVERHSGIACSC